MAPRKPGIQELRTRIETCRWQLYDGVRKLEGRLNFHRRLSNEVSAHPVKWVAMSLSAGVMAGQILPWILRRGSRSWLSSLLMPAIRTAGVAAFPVIVEAALHHLSGKPVHFSRAGSSDNTESGDIG